MLSRYCLEDSLLTRCLVNSCLDHCYQGLGRMVLRPCAEGEPMDIVFQMTTSSSTSSLRRKACFRVSATACIMVAVNSKCVCGLMGFYLKWNGNCRCFQVVCFFYSTPREGGNQIITNQQFEQYESFFTAFQFARILTAILALQMNATQQLSHPVIATASTNLLRDYHSALEYAALCS